MNLLPSMAIMFASLLGAILFYAFEFLAKKKLADFNAGTWFKDNWYKILLLAPLCLIAYIKYIDTSISEQSAFMLGLSVTTVIDRIGDIATKPKAV